MSGEWVTALISALLGGSLIGGIVSLLKLRPEGDQILVSSAKDVVLIQRDALADLRREMVDMQERFDEREQVHLEQLRACEKREQALARRVTRLEQGQGIGEP